MDNKEKKENPKKTKTLWILSIIGLVILVGAMIAEGILLYSGSSPQEEEEQQETYITYNYSN